VVRDLHQIHPRRVGIGPIVKIVAIVALCLAGLLVSVFWIPIDREISLLQCVANRLSSFTWSEARALCTLEMAVKESRQGKRRVCWYERSNGLKTCEWQ
jgi:hypothetical protein